MCVIYANATLRRKVARAAHGFDEALHLSIRGNLKLVFLALLAS